MIDFWNLSAHNGAKNKNENKAFPMNDKTVTAESNNLT